MEISEAGLESFFFAGFIKMKWILCTALFAARSSMKTVESFGKGGLFCRLDGMQKDIVKLLPESLKNIFSVTGVVMGIFSPCEF